MKERTILTGPGTFIGLSTNRVYSGKTISFYDGDKLVFEVSLNTPSPTKLDHSPGIEKYLFIRHGLRMAYPAEAEDDIQVFVGRD